jgi:hypothetical protein
MRPLTPAVSFRRGIVRFKTLSAKDELAVRDAELEIFSADAGKLRRQQKLLGPLVDVDRGIRPTDSEPFERLVHGAQNTIHFAFHVPKGVER